MNEIYIYDNTEVVKTGRKAEKQAEVKPKRSERTPQTNDVLFEITPADQETGSWKKWVRQSDLYIISETPEIK